MTNEEKDIKLAKLCGQAVEMYGVTKYCRTPFPDLRNAHPWSNEPPKYHLDLNALAAVEWKLDTVQQFAYWGNLCLAATGFGPKDFDVFNEYSLVDVARAKPLERLEALIKTLEET